MKATVFDIQRGSFVDGAGIRTTVFFKGCNLRCKWCHNPESLCKAPQILFYKDKCDGCKKCLSVCPNELKLCTLCGKCALFCPNGAREICGREYTPDELLGHILKDKSFYEASGGGVTLSGGECMLQTDFLIQILKMCKENGIHTAIDTAGNVPWESFEKILPYTDLLLYDIKCVTEKLHIEGTGVSNRLICDNLKRLSRSYSGEIVIRIPVIGGFNDSEAEMKKIHAFLKTVRCEKVELLPYHNMAEHKYNALNIPFTHFEATDDKIESFKKIFQA